MNTDIQYKLRNAGILLQLLFSFVLTPMVADFTSCREDINRVNDLVL